MMPGGDFLAISSLLQMHLADYQEENRITHVEKPS